MGRLKLRNARTATNYRKRLMMSARSWQINFRTRDSNELSRGQNGDKERLSPQQKAIVATAPRMSFEFVDSTGTRQWRRDHAGTIRPPCCHSHTHSAIHADAAASSENPPM